MNWNWKKPDWREVVIAAETFILFLLLFRNWDAVKSFLAGLLAG